MYLSHCVGVDDAPLDPAGHDDDGLPLLEVGVPALLHLGHAAADHGEGRAHPLGVGPHVRVNTQEKGSELDLIILENILDEENIIY